MEKLPKSIEKALNDEQGKSTARVWSPEQLAEVLGSAENKVKDLPPAVRELVEFSATAGIVSQSCKWGDATWVSCRFNGAGKVLVKSVKVCRTKADSNPYGRGPTEWLRVRTSNLTEDTYGTCVLLDMVNGLLRKAGVIVW